MNAVEINPSNAEVVRQELRSGGLIRSRVEGVISDLMDGGSASLDVNRGPAGTRSFIVFGIGAMPEFHPWVAIGAPGIPRIGDQYPGISSLPVQTINADPIDGFPSAAKVVVTYGIETIGGGTPDDPDAAPTVEVNTTLQTVKTNFDANGRVIALWHLKPIKGGELKLLDGKPNFVASDLHGRPVPDTEPVTDWKWDRQVVPMERQVPMTVITFRRKENLSPSGNALLYVGHVNSLAVFGDQPRTWLCTDLSGASSDGGVTYLVSYTFQRAADMAEPTDAFFKDLLATGFSGKTVLGWDVVARYVLPDGSTPDPFDLTSGFDPIGDGEGNYEKIFDLVQLYPSANFKDMTFLPF